MVKLLMGLIPVAKGTLPGRARKSLEKEVMMTMGESKKLFCLKLWLLGKLSLGSLFVIKKFEEIEPLIVK